MILRAGTPTQFQSDFDRSKGVTKFSEKSTLVGQMDSTFSRRNQTGRSGSDSSGTGEVKGWHSISTRRRVGQLSSCYTARTEGGGSKSKETKALSIFVNGEFFVGEPTDIDVELAYVSNKATNAHSAKLSLDLAQAGCWKVPYGMQVAGSRG
ncbi:hypothetical protein C8R44DRAFT_725167 [Mycena epipterygia]|nr:hypothetical protein C8R44DRAFT_725167 [Mycena epipterygia]